VAASPAETAPTTGWESATPQTAGRFTGVGYYFARQIHADLGVPVGILNASVGSTPVESWMDDASLAGDPAFAVVDERWRQALAEFPQKQIVYEAKLSAWSQAETAARAEPHFDRAAWVKKNPKPDTPPGPGHRWTPRGLYNGMVQPLVPYAVRGVLWYQGERNAADDHVDEYRALFAAMIRGWRAQFGRDDLPFFWVNLPNLIQGEPTGRRWAFLREAQTQVLALPHTGQAVTIDIGDPHNIHPANKQDVAARLVLLARNRVYGMTCPDTGPRFLRAESAPGVMRVFFMEAQGLQVRGGRVQALELAGTDRVFHPAEGRIENGTLRVASPAVPSPVAVRYAWTNAPEANLYNEAGLPAVPFRSDSW
jgi:sialate O-acetylesterase